MEIKTCIADYNVVVAAFETEGQFEKWWTFLRGPMVYFCATHDSLKYLSCVVDRWEIIPLSSALTIG